MLKRDIMLGVLHMRNNYDIIDYLPGLLEWSDCEDCQWCQHSVVTFILFTDVRWKKKLQDFYYSPDITRETNRGLSEGQGMGYAY